MKLCSICGMKLRVKHMRWCGEGSERVLLPPRRRQGFMSCESKHDIGQKEKGIVREREKFM